MAHVRGGAGVSVGSAGEAERQREPVRTGMARRQAVRMAGQRPVAVLVARRGQRGHQQRERAGAEHAERRAVGVRGRELAAGYCQATRIFTRLSRRPRELRAERIVQVFFFVLGAPNRNGPLRDLPQR